MQSLPELSDKEFDSMRRLIYDRFGISLNDQKRTLLVGRLQKYVAGQGFSSFGAYYEHVVNDKSEKALSQLVDRISTNHTFFNREKAHFNYFRETALPEIVARLKADGSNDLRIWCAGCSSGEEPFMLVMHMMGFFGGQYDRWNAGILATDISQRALEQARRAEYAADRLRDLPVEMRSRFFNRNADGNWAVRPELKKEVVFRRFNLMNDHFPFKKPFHMIFCRNVMIYFDQQTKDALVGRFHKCLVPGGYLFIGHSESIGRDQALLSYLQPATYQKK